MSVKVIAILFGLVLCLIIGYFIGKRVQIDRMVPRFQYDFGMKFAGTQTRGIDNENRSFHDIIKEIIRQKKQECIERGLPAVTGKGAPVLDADYIIWSIVYHAVQLNDGELVRYVLNETFGDINMKLEENNTESA